MFKKSKNTGYFFDSRSSLFSNSSGKKSYLFKKVIKIVLSPDKNLFPNKDGEAFDRVSKQQMRNN